MSPGSKMDSAKPDVSGLAREDASVQATCNRHLHILPALTPTGAKQVRMPAELHRAIARFLEQHRHLAWREENVEEFIHSSATDVPSELVPLNADPELQRRIVEELQPILEQWCGCPLEPIWAFGVRIYNPGSVLHRHIDTLETHVISAALQVAQDLDEPWPLVVENFDGSHREFVLEPGDALLYEGTKLPHFRDTPLRGHYYASVFVHYRPRWWRFTEERIQDQIDQLPPSYPRRSLAYGRSNAASRPSTPAAQPDRYLSFEVDGGGWNNILMQLEIMLALAWLTDRTVVLPPATPIYLLGEAPRFLTDLLDETALRGQLPVLSAAEFATSRGLDHNAAQHEGFHDYMERNGHSPDWNAVDDVCVHPEDAFERRPELEERVVGRRVVSIDAAARNCELLYFPMNTAHRMLGVAECFFLLEDEARQRALRTLLRDALRYRPEIIDLAERAMQSPALAGGAFSALHIRRNDFHFQYEETNIAAKEILRHIRGYLVPGETLYLATDETDNGFFRDLREHFHIVTFDQLGDAVVSSTPIHWRGIVETLICAAAPGRFIGTRLSTFSARIAILRGHLSRVADGDCEGIDTTLYYTQPPIGYAPDASDTLPEPFARHVEAFVETAEPWWKSLRRVPVWGRAYREIWTETDG